MMTADILQYIADAAFQRDFFPLDHTEARAYLLRGAGSAMKTAAVGSAAGYVAWQNLVSILSLGFL